MSTEDYEIDDAPVAVEEEDSAAERPSLYSFENMEVVVLGSAVRVDAKSQRYTVYVVSVITAGVEVMRIEKRYNNFVDLDQLLRREHSSLTVQLPKLPEKVNFFNRLAPGTIDARKAAFEQYLNSLLLLFPNWAPLQAFLSSNLIVNDDEPSQSGAHRRGYLSKPGRTFGTWTSRYFVYQGGSLSYYMSEADAAASGKPRGSILLELGATARPVPDETEGQRHAFEVIAGGRTHLLCAENDQDRDAWVATLQAHIDMMVPINELSLDSSANGIAGQLQYRHKPFTPMRPRYCSTDGLSMSIFKGQVKTDNLEAPMLSIPLTRHVHIEVPATTSASKEQIASVGEEEDAGAADAPPALAGGATGVFEIVVASNGPLPSTRHRFMAETAELRDAWVQRLRMGVERAMQEEAAEEKQPTSPTQAGSGPVRKFKFGRKKSSVVAFVVVGAHILDACENTALPDGPAVPALMRRCIEFVEAAGLQREGIYRLSGTLSEVNQLRDMFNKDPTAMIPEDADPHAVAALLKLYLRSLPEPLLTNHLRVDFYTVASLDDRDTRLTTVRQLLSLLPNTNRVVLKYMISHLNRVRALEAENKMTVRNLGIVFSNTLLVPARVFSDLLTDYVYLLGGEDDDVEGGAGATNQDEEAEWTQQQDETYEDAGYEHQEEGGQSGVYQENAHEDAVEIIYSDEDLQQQQYEAEQQVYETEHQSYETDQADEQANDDEANDQAYEAFESFE